MPRARLSNIESSNFTIPMSLKTHFLILASLLLLAPSLSIGQEQRPALIPSQGGGSGSGASQATSSVSIGGLTDGPISPGDTVHIIVFDAPDFSVVTRVSQSGEVPYPILGAIHIGGLTSATASELVARQLKDRNLMLDPVVTVTVDSASTGITVLGEVRSPGVSLRRESICSQTCLPLQVG